MILVVAVARSRRRRCRRRDHRRDERRAHRHGCCRADGARPGAPPLSLDLGVRVDPRQSTSARRFASTRPASAREAAKLFARHDSLEARIGESFSHWPDGTVAAADPALGAAPEERRRAAQPRDRPVLGRRGRGEGRVEVGRRARAGHGVRRHRRQPAPPGLRPQSADLRALDGGCRRAIRKLAAPAQLALLERRARTGTDRRPALLRRRAAAARQAAVGRARLRRGRRGARRRTRRRASPRPSGSSTRPSPAQAFSPARPALARRSRRRPRCASTSACCCSGRAR